MEPLPTTHTVQPQTGLTNAFGPNYVFLFYFIFFILWGAKGIHPQGTRTPAFQRQAAGRAVPLAVPARSLAHRGAGPP